MCNVQMRFTIEGLSRRKPYVTFHFVILKIPSFARVIGFFFIPNIRTIDNKVEEEETKRRQKNWSQLFFSVGLLRGCCFCSCIASIPCLFTDKSKFPSKIK